MSSLRHWRDCGSSQSSTSGQSDSNTSYQSRSTAPTNCSDCPSIPRRDPCDPQQHHSHGKPRSHESQHYEDSRASVETYASTDEEADAEEEDAPEFAVPAGMQEVSMSDAIPATPRDFSDLFPSSHRLSIRHDDTTIDGNMNLRVDTHVDTGRGKQALTLFHLRMHDLKTRDCSLRRYCRESGREVCHSARKYQQLPSEKRPKLQRSVSSAIASLRHKAEPKTNGAANLRRSDSGYESMFGTEDDHIRPKTSAGPPQTQSRLPTNTIKIEFSNYAHVEIKRRGAKGKKRYNFEYWGINYAWKRVSKRDGSFKEVSYHLLQEGSDQTLAHIVPVPLTTSQVNEETARGGWIPPCSLWITDEKIINGSCDLSDVVMSTGLMALVDDSIKRHFHSKQTTQLLIPLTKSSSFKMNMEYIGPKRLIDEVFHRTTHSATPERQTLSRRPTTAA